MAKPLKKILKTVEPYDSESASPGDKHFMSKHKVEVTDDANGNDDDVFNAGKEDNYDHNIANHGHNKDQSKAVYEGLLDTVNKSTSPNRKNIVAAVDKAADTARASSNFQNKSADASYKNVAAAKAKANAAAAPTPPKVTKEEKTVEESHYSKSAVDKQLDKDGIKGKKKRALYHALLKGHQKTDEPEDEKGDKKDKLDEVVIKGDFGKKPSAKPAPSSDAEVTDMSAAKEARRKKQFGAFWKALSGEDLTDEQYNKMQSQKLREFFEGNH